MIKHSSEQGLYIYGERTEVKALFKSIIRAAKKGKTNILFPYEKMPIFAKKRKMYALLFDKENHVYVINSDQMLDVLSH